MTNDFIENIYRTSAYVEDTTLNTIDEDSLMTDDIHLSIYPMSAEYILDNNNSINPKEWSVIDAQTHKPRPPRQNEFLLLLLANPSYSSYISWIDKSDGLCKIHQPQKVADLWAKVKNRQTAGAMNYSIFARGIRFYYKSGLMSKTYKKHTIRFKLPLQIITV
jgi:hypothetical protein